MRINSNFNILETTLRDGNYLVDFGFSAMDTASLAKLLEMSGIKYIEIGHGLGLGASNKFKPAASSDTDYIKGAKESTKNALIGVFAIPGIATLDDIKKAADSGLDFIRIGADVENTRSMEDYVKLARNLDLFTCTNFMKTSAIQPKDFPNYALMAQEYGSQMVYLVDSVGNMLPTELEDYIKILTEKINIPFGFHGHDNLGFANANSLLAFSNNALMVDTTLLGIGRGSGNASTEVIVNTIQDKYKSLKNLDGKFLIKIANLKIEKLVALQSAKSISAIFGLSKVHSMYTKLIKDYSEKHNLDLFSLVKAVGEIDAVNCDNVILDKAKDKIKTDGYDYKKLNIIIDSKFYED